MSLDSMLGNVGIYLAVISALAIGVERIMDYVKSLPFLRGKLVRKPRSISKDAEERKREDEEEEARGRAINMLAVPVGIVLAFIVQVDTFDILGLNSPYWGSLPILGYVLSGLAASRGSAFWHDVLDIVAEIKNAKREVTAAGRQTT